MQAPTTKAFPDAVGIVITESLANRTSLLAVRKELVAEYKFISAAYRGEYFVSCFATLKVFEGSLLTVSELPS